MDIHYINEIQQIQFITPDEGWAISRLPHDNSSALVHFRNNNWQIGSVFPGIKLNDLEMVSLEEGWAAGEYYCDRRGVILHYEQRTWSIVKNVANAVRSITMVSPTDGWAIATDDLRSCSSLLRCQDGIWIPYNPEYSYLHEALLISKGTLP